jgi:hypothetical protein
VALVGMAVQMLVKIKKGFVLFFMAGEMLSHWVVLGYELSINQAMRFP